MNDAEVRHAYSALSRRYIEAFGSGEHEHPDDVHRIERHLGDTSGLVLVGFFEGPRFETFEHKVVTAYRWPVDDIAGRLATAGFREVERLQRPRAGERRPHAALAARAI